jgi:hypothetical protein
MNAGFPGIGNRDHRFFQALEKSAGNSQGLEVKDENQ